MTDTTALENAVQLFRDAYATSKAYKHFVDSSGLDPHLIQSEKDFTKIPIMDRHNYINKYPLEDRLYNGKKLDDFYMISGSSGSTGEPTFWPRDIMADEKLEKMKEQLYQEHFNIQEKPTLCVIAFALGVWTGGMLTAKLSWAASKTNKFTVVTPGTNKQNVFSFIEKLYPLYDQVLLLAYPPFVLDLIDFTEEKKFDLKKINLKVMVTGEGVSERWRNFVTEKISATNNRHDVVSFYACSDTGIIGTETKFSIDFLDFCYKNQDLSKELFGVLDPPTFVSYNPKVKYLEAVDSEILITARQPVPLIRYNIHDRGGLLEKDKVRISCTAHNIPIDTNAISDDFAYILGRSDAVLIAANIYIEDIRYCIENSKFKERLTGNFQYGTLETTDLRKQLKVIIFHKKNASLSVNEQKKFRNEFYTNLMVINDDFKVIYNSTKMAEILFVFKMDNPDRFNKTKLKYFL